MASEYKSLFKSYDAFIIKYFQFEQEVSKKVFLNFDIDEALKNAKTLLENFKVYFCEHPLCVRLILFVRKGNFLRVFWNFKNAKYFLRDSCKMFNTNYSSVVSCSCQQCKEELIYNY